MKAWGLGRADKMRRRSAGGLSGWPEQNIEQRSMDTVPADRGPIPCAPPPKRDAVEDRSPRIAALGARATNQLRATLLRASPTHPYLSTEGEGYADVGLKQAVEQAMRGPHARRTRAIRWRPEATAPRVLRPT